MLRVEQIRDFDQLRQMAVLLERENDRLHARIAELAQQLAAAQGGDATAALQQELALLQEQLQRRTQALFGDSSERRPAARVEPIVAPRVRKGHGPTKQPQLPIVEVTHQLPQDERDCPACGGHLDEMKGQYEESEEITVVQRRFEVHKHLRTKYRCRCNGAVVTAPGPLKLTKGGRYSIEFAVEAAASKWLDHQPLDRQCRIMRREGLVIDSQTVWDQVDALARPLVPTWEAIGRLVLAEPVILADETWWRMMPNRRGDRNTKRWWVWGVMAPILAFYRLMDSRATESAKALLGDYGGKVVADGYGVYDVLSRAGPGSFLLAQCWAHSRRGFAEIEANYPRECQAILDMIGELYVVEAQAPPCDPFVPPVQQEAALQERLRLRQELSHPITTQIHEWVIEQLPLHLPQGGMGKALNYVAKRWKGLTVFLQDQRVPLDTNAAERALRGVVLGRKNHYGSRSKRGAEVAAIFYTLFESAKLCGVEPKAYVMAAAAAALRAPGTVTLPAALRIPS